MMKTTLLFIALLFLIAGCSTAQVIDVGEGDASVALGELDAEVGGVPMAGTKVELDGCILIFRNIDWFLSDDTSPKELVSSINMKTPTCSFGNVIQPVGTNGVLAPSNPAGIGPN